MKMFSDCSGYCCVCANNRGCLAGHGDDDYSLASKERIIDNLDKNLYPNDIDRMITVLKLKYDYDYDKSKVGSIGLCANCTHCIFSYGCGRERFAKCSLNDKETVDISYDGCEQFSKRTKEQIREDNRMNKESEVIFWKKQKERHRKMIEKIMLQKFI